ncbi:hypothetical protein ACA910_004265 [Epithemia clementina (nom. ined.)]
MERVRGFLVYVTLTYGSVSPYLKGLHLTLESWRVDWDRDGWRMTPSEFSLLCKDKGLDLIDQLGLEGDKEPPLLVTPVPRLIDDVRNLLALTEGETPPRVLVRPKASASAAIMFGDASGTGFGTSFWIQGGHTVDAEHVTWTRDYSSKSSNFREFYNLVLRIEALMQEKKKKTGTELFVFTDNSTMESAFYRGTSTSKSLFDLVLRLRKLEMDGKLFIHVVWIAGTRMIDQGTNGLSTGDLDHGVLAGMDMLQFVPLHRMVEERQPGFVNIILDSMERIFPATHISPQGWFEDAFEPGNYVWTPPPAVALEALEQLCESKQVRPSSVHVFACPALMTNRWQKKLGRVADIIFTVPVNTDVWSDCQHEPVIIALILHLFNCRPWHLKRNRKYVDDFVTSLHQMWPSGSSVVRDHLRKLWTHVQNIAKL